MKISMSSFNCFDHLKYTCCCRSNEKKIIEHLHKQKFFRSICVIDDDWYIFCVSIEFSTFIDPFYSFETVIERVLSRMPTLCMQTGCVADQFNSIELNCFACFGASYTLTTFYTHRWEQYPYLVYVSPFRSLPLSLILLLSLSLTIFFLSLSLTHYFSISLTHASHSLLTHILSTICDCFYFLIIWITKLAWAMRQKARFGTNNRWEKRHIGNSLMTTKIPCEKYCRTSICCQLN